MSNLQEELSLLREESKALNQQLIRFSFARVLTVLIFVFSLADGFQTISSDKEVRATQHKIDSVAIDFSKSKVNSQERDTLRDALNKLRRKVEPQLKKAFTLSLSFLGGSLELDTRTWIYILPILLLFSQIYSSLLSRKQKILRTIAFAHIEASHNTDDISIVDRLMFPGRSSLLSGYNTYPHSLAKWTMDLALAVIVWYYISSWWTATNDWTIVRFLAQFLAICSMFGVLLYRVLSNRLEANILSIAGVEKRNEAIYSWEKSKRIIRALSGSHKRSLLTGSILVLLSLPLATSKDFGCNSVDKVKGYEIVKQGLGSGLPLTTAIIWDKNGEYESVAIDILPPVPLVLSLYGDQALYVICLGIAIFSIPLSVSRKNLFEYRESLFPRILIGAMISFACLVFFSSAGYFGMFICNLALVAILLDFFPLALESIEALYEYVLFIFVVFGFYFLIRWLRFVFAKKQVESRQFRFIRFSMTLCTPVNLIGLMMVTLVAMDYPGLLAYFAGLNLLFIGYLKIAVGSLKSDVNSE